MKWQRCLIVFVLMLTLSGCEKPSTSSGPQPRPSTTSLAPSTTQGEPGSSSTSSSDPRIWQQPNPLLTPGVVDPRVTQGNLKTTVCRSGAGPAQTWSEAERPTSSVTNQLKRLVAAGYGISPFIPEAWEGDHLIAIGVGGLPRDLTFEGKKLRLIHNFWDEPREGGDTDRKDKLETKLHFDLCAGRITLKQAQEESLHFWKYW